MNDHEKPYRVKYYDERLSHLGRGVQVMAFETEGAAQEFASQNKLYGKPCTVTVASPLTLQWEKQESERLTKSMARIKWAPQRRRP